MRKIFYDPKPPIEGEGAESDSELNFGQEAI